LFHKTQKELIERLGLWPERPKVLSISVPKSGTNLLSRVLALMPGLRHAQVNLQRPKDVNHLRACLERGYRGSFIKGHVHFTEAFAQVVEELDYKRILIVRDPRDVTVSLMYWATYKYKEHRLRPYLQSFPSDAARLQAIIEGAPAAVLGDERPLQNVGKFVGIFLPWIEHDTYLIKFEELVGPQGGGSRESQEAVLLGLSKYLSITLTEEDLQRIITEAFSSRSHTFRKGQIGDWKNHYTEEHKQAFKRIAGDLLIEMGYEQDEAW
jgi:hypothetical protein